jgi:hypothetical protein
MANLRAARATPGEDAFLKFIFSCHENPFWLFETYCRNLDCNCQAAVLTFVEVSPEEKPLPRGIEFSMVLHFDDWHTKISDRSHVSKEKLQAILAEFSRGLTPELKERFRNHYREARRMAKQAAQFELSEAEIKSGAQRGYWEVYGEPGAFFSFEFDYENQKYLIGDQYCLNPDCDCQRAFITFTTIDPRAKSSKNVFGIFLDFKAQCEIAFSEYPESKLREIASAWLQRQPELLNVLAYRYKQMKAVGRQVLERNRKRQTTRKTSESKPIGRNAPCPCGSGKKYKKCCGK